MSFDLTVATQGSIFWLTSTSDAGRSWLEEHIPKDAITWQGSVGVEHCDIRDIVEGVIADGLTIDDRWCLDREIQNHIRRQSQDQAAGSQPACDDDGGS